MIWQTRYMSSATALAHPNIAFIKYRGNRDNALRLPSNGSISIDIIGINRQVTKNAKKCSKSPRSALGVPI
jgi:mevalonate pyrophosphate decarboxylase